MVLYDRADHLFDILVNECNAEKKQNIVAPWLKYNLYRQGLLETCNVIIDHGLNPEFLRPTAKSTLHKAFGSEDDAAEERKALLIGLRSAKNPLTGQNFVSTRFDKGLCQSLANDKNPSMAKLPYLVMLSGYHFLHRVSEGFHNDQSIMKVGHFNYTKKKNTSHPRDNLIAVEEPVSELGDEYEERKLNRLADFALNGTIGTNRKNRIPITLNEHAEALFVKKKPGETPLTKLFGKNTLETFQFDVALATSPFFPEKSDEEPKTGGTSGTSGKRASARKSGGTSSKSDTGKGDTGKEQKQDGKNKATTGKRGKGGRNKEDKPEAGTPKALEQKFDAAADAIPLGNVNVRKKDAEIAMSTLKANIGVMDVSLNNVDEIEHNRKGKDTGAKEELRTARMALANGMTTFNNLISLLSLDTSVGRFGDDRGNQGDHTTVTSVSALPTKDSIERQLKAILGRRNFGVVEVYDQDMLINAFDWTGKEDEHASDNFAWDDDDCDEIFAIKLNSSSMEQWYEAYVSRDQASKIQKSTFDYLDSLEEHEWTSNLAVFEKQQHQPSPKCTILVVMKTTYYRDGKGPVGRMDESSDGDVTKAPAAKSPSPKKKSPAVKGKSPTGKKKPPATKKKKSPAAKTSLAAKKKSPEQEATPAEWKKRYDRIAKYVKKQKEKSGIDVIKYPNKKDELWVQEQHKEYKKYQATKGIAGKLNEEQYQLIADHLGLSKDAHEESLPLEGEEAAATPEKTSPRQTRSSSTPKAASGSSNKRKSSSASKENAKATPPSRTSARKKRKTN